MRDTHVACDILAHKAALAAGSAALRRILDDVALVLVMQNEVARELPRLLPGKYRRKVLIRP